jgi:lipoate-protein ligase A
MVRLVDTDLARPQLTAAIDEALLLSRMAGRSGDTVHLYRRRPPSVSIGYFQSAAEVADLEACRADGIPVVRRISAGGAIYTDERQLVYALAHDPPRPLRAKEGLDIGCDAVVRTLARLGVEDARREGVNDVLVGTRKVSGSAQVIRRGVHLVHGTMLVDVDRTAMVRYLGQDRREGSTRVGTTPGGRVTTLAEVMGAPPPLDTVKAILAEELATAVGGVVEPGDLDAWERAEAARLEGERYANDEWNLRRGRPGPVAID